MERRQTSLIWGIGLLVVGALLLLRNLDVIPDTGEFSPAVLFIVGGAVFGWLYISNRDQWWWIIPSGALLGIGLLIGLTGLSPSAGGRWGGSIFWRAWLPVSSSFSRLTVTFGGRSSLEECCSRRRLSRDCLQTPAN